MAAGSPKPIVPRPPDERKLRVCEKREGLFVGEAGDGIDHLAHVDIAFGGMQLGPDDLFLLHLAAAAEAFQPLGMLALLHLFGEEGEHLARIALDAHRDGDDFPDFGRVDVDVDDVGLRGVGVHGAGDPVVETHAHGDE